MRGYEVANLINERRNAIATEVMQLERFQRHAEHDAARLSGALEDAWVTLAATVVPILDGTGLDQVAQALHLRAIGAAQVRARLQTTHQQLADRLRRAEQNPLYVEREGALNAAAIQKAELTSAYAPLLESTGALEAEPLFVELVDQRYDTPDYAVKFWQVSYYRHWKHGDLIVEKHGARYGVETFGALAVKYLAEREARDTLHAQLRGVREQTRAIGHAINDVDTLRQQLQDVPATVLTDTRRRVREHLKDLPEAEVFKLLQHSPASTLAYKRVIGLQKQMDYLRELARETRAPIQALRTQSNKLHRKAAKMMRTKNYSRTFSRHEVDRTVGVDKSASWAKRRQRLHETRTRVVEFHHYDRYDPMRDLLWWDYMSDGRLDGRFFDEVSARPHRPSVPRSAPDPSGHDIDDHGIDDHDLDIS